MPTGLKVAIGCIVVFFSFAAIAAVLLGVGGWWVKGQAEDLMQGVQNRTEAQQEATDILDRLEREHPFTTPSNNGIDPGSANRFFRATELAWTRIEPTVRRLDEVADRNREGRARLGDALEGFRGTGLLIDSRLHIARALDEVGMSLDEYVWIGGTLRSAHRDTDSSLADEYRERMDSMDPSADDPTAWTVYQLATVWSRGLPDGSLPSP